MASLDGTYLATGKLNVPYLMQNAEILFDAGDYALARKIYKTILQSGEHTGIVLYYLGRCLEAEGKVEEACSKYEESVVFHPALESYQRWVSLLFRMNKDQQAAEVMERIQALTDSPNTLDSALRSFTNRPGPRKGKGGV
jgi:tetratricopeptide (TPR) repeat protein